MYCFSSIFSPTTCNLQDSTYKCVFTSSVEFSVDPDQNGIYQDSAGQGLKKNTYSTLTDLEIIYNRHFLCITKIIGIQRKNAHIHWKSFKFSHALQPDLFTVRQVADPPELGNLMMI